MKEIWCSSLGETWLAVLREVVRAGQAVGDETRELLNVCAAFERGIFPGDPLLDRFASPQFVGEMRKVFFTSEANQFGHSYRDKLRGPQGRNDLSDIIGLLRHDPWSKRAVVALTGSGDGKVPCINTIHFLRREEGLTTNYFARGQDIFRKYYADGVCIFDMAARVASALGVPLLRISGLISSAHIYQKDLSEIHALLADAETFQQQRTALNEAAA